MARTTIDEKIVKLNKAIKCEEIIIKASREKIKKYEKQIKELNAQKDIQFANDFIKIISSSALTDEQRQQLLNSVKISAQSFSSSDSESVPSENLGAENENNYDVQNSETERSDFTKTDVQNSVFGRS